MGLQNRFVVAVSRARLGFFVVGSVKAVTTNRNGSDGPAHWRRFIESLKQTESLSSAESEGISRCGNGLPVCCPRHGQLSQRTVSKAADFPDEGSWNAFCKAPCNSMLERCGHMCKLPCHSPVSVKHNEQCTEQLVRPCETHAEVPLLCHDLDIDTFFEESLEQALARFHCKIKVEYCRPECNHVVQISCHKKTEVVNMRKVLSACEVVVSDYIHPVCNHSFPQPKCAKKREYEANPPKCTTRVSHRRPCGCVLNMQCFERIEELKTPAICKSSVQFQRPRCGHMLSMRCFEAEKLKANWDEQSGKSAIDSKLLFNKYY